MVECVCNVGDNVYSPILNLPPPPPGERFSDVHVNGRESAVALSRCIQPVFARDATLVGDSNDA